MPSRRDAEERSHRRAGYRPARAGQVNRRLHKGETTRRRPSYAAGTDGQRATGRGRRRKLASSSQQPLPKYHLVRGHFGKKEYERPYLCARGSCLRLHWTIGTGPARDLTSAWIPLSGRTPSTSAPRIWLVASRRAAELLTDLIDCSSTFVDGIADAFGLDDVARESARQIKTWPQMKEMLEKQGVIGTQVPIKQRGLFWETIQDLINKEALSLEQEPAA